MTEDRPYLSVGEVLELLRSEFADLSISKVRELESQGHLRPERTASGYRKFYDDDIARLRELLRHEPTAEGTGVDAPSGGIDDVAVRDAERRHPASYRQLRRRGVRPESDPTLPLTTPAVAAGSQHPPGTAPSAALGASARQVASAAASSRAGSTPLSAPTPGEARAAARLAVVRDPQSGGNGGSGLAASTRLSHATREATGTGPGHESAASTEPVGGAGRRDVEAPRSGSANPLLANGTGVSLSLSELATAAGADPALIRELEQYGLVSGRAVFGSTIYDEDALLVTRAAAAFARHGVEPRHLRLYRSLAERELAFFEQVLSPQLHHRSGEGRQKAGEVLGELVRLGEQLRTATVRVAARASMEQYRAGG